VRQLGRYEIVEELGRGAMSIVYRAHDPLLDREIALKTLSAEAMHDSELLERFRREARISARLRHPNIAAIYDFGQEPGSAYIVMELLEGSDLRRIISSRSEISLQRKLEVVADVADGLAYAHSIGVIHRDIKPSNVFVGDDGRSRILDFGVAHLPSSTLTVVGRVLGTPQYMSPEHLSGAPCDERSDIFSLAVLTYEFLTLDHPFVRQPVNSLPQTESAALLPPSAAIPDAVLEVLRRAVRNSPKERYDTALELAHALLSAQSAPVNRLPLDQTPLPKPLPAVAGGTQTVLSAVLIHLQNFEDAAERHDLRAARSAMVGMRQAAASDTRFAVALQQSAKRLEELESEQPSTAITPLPASESPAPPFSLDATSLFRPESDAASIPAAKWSASAPPHTPVPRIASPLPSFSVPVPTATPIPRTPVPVALPPPARATNTSINLDQSDPAAHVPPRSLWPNLFRLAAVLLVCAALGAAFYFFRQRSEGKPVRLLAVATAEVGSPETRLYAAPDATQSPVVTLHRGDVVNVLRAPRYSEQQWTAVQWISAGRISPPAFAHTADLSNWSSSDSTLDEQLRHTFSSKSLPAPHRSHSGNVP
jgi:serine/threonine-protein kinase